MICFPAGAGESHSPLPSSCSGKVDESSFYISPYELNANSISDIKSFKPSYQLSFLYDHGPFNPSPLWDKIDQLIQTRQII
jgi:hypothetical protein